MVFQINVPVGEARPGETAPYRFYKCKDQALTRPSGYKAKTVYEFINEACSKGKGSAVAYRDLVDVQVETKKVTKVVDGEQQEVSKEWIYYKLSPYRYLLFSEWRELIHDLGRGLVALGLEPNQKDRLHIYAATQYRWMATFLATTSQNIPIVTAYDTLGELGLVHLMRQTGLVAMFTDNALLPLLVLAFKQYDGIKYLIHAEPIDENDKRQGGAIYKKAHDALETLKKEHPGLKVVLFAELVQLGKDHPDIQPSPPRPDDLACIMYTSGSTGTPKGVVLKHENIVAGVAGVLAVVGRDMISSEDVVIAFLPLAHIFELVFELITFYWGATLGYANVKTLSDTSVRECQGDMKELHPTIMVGVAAVWETIKKGILAQVSAQPPFAQKVFWTAYKAKMAMVNRGIPGSGVIDNLIFKKVKQATGGRLRLCLNGGLPLLHETQAFISNLLLPMLIGYGLTETCANTCVVLPQHFEQGVAGAVVGSVTVKLVDVADAGYFAKDNRGEVCIRGAPVMLEYYENEKETKEAIDEEGWFHTGDIGEWTASGNLKLIDRKKNLVKTLNGEYIALEKLESAYRANLLVHNICCYADADHSKPIGIVVPNEAAVRQFAADKGIYKSADGADWVEMCSNTKLSNAITKLLVLTAKLHGLAGIELILGIVLVEEEWTPQNGFVTLAMKLQRKKILESVKPEVDALYGK